MQPYCCPICNKDAKLVLRDMFMANILEDEATASVDFVRVFPDCMYLL